MCEREREKWKQIEREIERCEREREKKREGEREKWRQIEKERERETERGDLLLLRLPDILP